MTRVYTTPKKYKGQVTGYQFYYRENGKLKKLNLRQHPEIGNIRTLQQAQDFCKRLNKDLDLEAKRLQSITNAALRTEAFDFDDALAVFEQAQEKDNKYFLQSTGQVREILNILIHDRLHNHPAGFDEDSYQHAFEKVGDARDLSLGTLEKMRASFNKWLKVMRRAKKLSFGQCHPIPSDTVRAAYQALSNKLTTSARPLDERAPKFELEPEPVAFCLTYSQVCHLVDFATAHPDQLDPLIAKLFFIAAIVTHRPNAYLAVYREAVRKEKDERGRHCIAIYCPKTVQKYQRRDGGFSRKVDVPSRHKAPPYRMPVYNTRAQEYLREWVAHSEAHDSQWLFPDPTGYKGGPKGEHYGPYQAPFLVERLSSLFTRYLKVAGLPRIPLKNLRQTALNITSPHQTLEQTQKQAGHRVGSRVTRDHYLKPETFSYLGDVWEKVEKSS